MTMVLAAGALGPGLVAEVVEAQDRVRRTDDVVAALPLHSHPGAPVRWFVVRHRASASAAGLPALPRELLAGWLAPLPAGEREAVVRVLASATVRTVGDLDDTAAVLHGVRQALRERLPRPHDPSRAPSATSVHRLDDRHVHLFLHLPGPVPAGGLVAVSPEGHRVGLPAAAAGEAVVCCRLPSPSRLRTGWLLEHRPGDGPGWEIAAADVTTDPLEVMAALAEQWGGPAPPCPRAPAVWQELRRRLWAGAHVLVDRAYGDVPAHPRRSRAVLLADDAAAAEHAVLRLLHREEPDDVELLLVLDGGRPPTPALEQLESLHRLYGVPFRALVPDRRVDRDLGVELAARSARARLEPADTAAVPAFGGRVAGHARTPVPRPDGSLRSSTTPRGEKHGFL